MAKTKTKYVARKTVAKSRLHSADGKQVLTIALKEGSGKFNIAATIRDADKESDTPAQTGARESFTDVDAGKKAVEKLTADAQKKGWKLIPSSVSGSFSEIPESPKAKK